MNAEYQSGREARRRGKQACACPHGHRTHHKDLETGKEMGLSDLARRHWWLAGWHDRDIEMGNRVIEGGAA